METLSSAALLAARTFDSLQSALTGHSVESHAKEYLKQQCVGGLLSAVLGDENAAKYGPLIPILFTIIKPPEKTGDEEADEQAWIEHVDKNVRDYEMATGNQFHEMFSEDFIHNFEVQTGHDGDFFRTRESLLEMLYDSPRFSGIVEGFLAQPLSSFADHSLTIEDRFHMYLPEWIQNMNISPGIRLVGDTNRQPPINLRSLNIVGFAFYDKNENMQKEQLSNNPMEMFDARPSGTDKFGNDYQYHYYGPNNPMTDEYIADYKPINLLDQLGFDHDLAYVEFGYNTPGATQADLELIDGIQQAIAEGTINEDSPFDEFDLAKKGLLYFSTITNK